MIFRTDSFRLKFNKYQNAYLSVVSKKFSRLVSILSDWFYFQLKGRDNKFEKELCNGLAYYDYKYFGPGFPSKSFEYEFRKLPTRISINVLKLSLEIAKSRIQKCKKGSKFNLKFKGFIFTDLGSCGNKSREIKLPRSRYLKTLFKDPVKVTIPSSVYKNIKSRTSDYYLRFYWKNGKWFVDIVKKIKIQNFKSSSKIYAAIDINMTNIAFIDEVRRQPVIFSLVNTILKCEKYYLKSIKNKKRYYKTNNRKYLNRMRRYQEKIFNSFRETFKLFSIRIVDWCLKFNINKIVIGNVSRTVNKGMMNKLFRRLWNMIPFTYFINFLKSYADKYNIFVYTISEDYTSKASSIDNDKIPDHKLDDVNMKWKFSGKRVSRGLYLSKHGVVIHADINAAANILRKAARRFGKCVKFDKFDLSRVRKVGYHILKKFSLETAIQLKILKDFGMVNPGHCFYNYNGQVNKKDVTVTMHSLVV